MFNKVILMGRLTKDPEIRTTQTGITMCRFSIAVERRFSGNNGEKQTDFFDVTAWRQTADLVSKWFSKGKMILVEGSLQNNNYTDNNGVKHYSTAIIAENVSFTGDKSGNPQGNSGSNNPQEFQNANSKGFQNNGYAQTAQTPQNYSPNPQFVSQVQKFPQAQPMLNPQPIPAQGNSSQVQLGNLSDFGQVLSYGTVPF